MTADHAENLARLLEICQVRGASARYRHERAEEAGEQFLAAAMGGKAGAYREVAQLIENALNGIEITRPTLSAIPLSTNRRPIARTPRGGVSSARKNQVKRRGGGYCHYCGKQSSILEVEHIVPRTLGGTVALSNLVTACTRCNDDKASALWPEHCDFCRVAIATWWSRQMHTLWQNWPLREGDNA